MAENRLSERQPYEYLLAILLLNLQYKLLKATCRGSAVRTGGPTRASATRVRGRASRVESILTAREINTTGGVRKGLRSPGRGCRSTHSHVNSV